MSQFIAHYGMLAIFVLMALESACIPIPSEAVVPYGGYLAFNHELTLWGVILVSTIANLVGGLIAYYVGLAGGRPFILRYGRYILLNRHHLERAERWFARRGELTVLICRLLPALRTFISLPAGVARMNLPKFILYSFIGSLPWNIGLAIAGYQLGKHWEAVGHAVKPITYIGAILLVAAVLWFWFGRKRQVSNTKI